MIYIVTKGRYSDYHVIAATTNHELAKNISEKFSDNDGWDDCRIEEFPDAEVMLKSIWRVYFERSGDVWKCELSDSEYDYRDLNHTIDVAYKGYYDLIVTVEADDKESAIKIAAEKRAQYLAEKLGL